MRKLRRPKIDCCVEGSPVFLGVSDELIALLENFVVVLINLEEKLTVDIRQFL